LNSVNHADALQRCILQTNDLEQQAESLTNWLQEYDQMSAGVFSGRVDKLSNKNLHIFSEYTSRALHQHCQIWPDAIWFGIPSEKSESMRINGENLSANALATKVGDESFELDTPEDFNIYGIVLESSFLNQIADFQGIELRELEVFKTPVLDVDSNRLASLKYCLNEIIASNTSNMASNIKEDILISSLLQTIPKKTQYKKHLPSYKHRKQVVERVKNYIHTRQNLPVTITELCQIAFVSRRTLQYSFESILGYTPLHFIRMTRLNQVRRALKNAPKDSTVTEIAEFWGFTHAGQFGSDYKKLFGELPSKTLCRFK